MKLGVNAHLHSPLFRLQAKFRSETFVPGQTGQNWTHL